MNVKKVIKENKELRAEVERLNKLLTDRKPTASKDSKKDNYEKAIVSYALDEFIKSFTWMLPSVFEADNPLNIKKFHDWMFEIEKSKMCSYCPKELKNIFEMASFEELMIVLIEPLERIYLKLVEKKKNEMNEILKTHYKSTKISR